MDDVLASVQRLLDARGRRASPSPELRRLLDECLITVAAQADHDGDRAFVEACAARWLRTHHDGDEPLDGPGSDAGAEDCFLKVTAQALLDVDVLFLAACIARWRTMHPAGPELSHVLARRYFVAQVEQDLSRIPVTGADDTR